MSAETDDFEAGRCWAQYAFMEDEFLDFMRYVPYMKCKTNVFSPRLAEMLLEICGYIDSLFKLMARYGAFKNNPGCQGIIRSEATKKPRARHARRVYEKIYSLSTNNGSHIIARLPWHGPKEMKPFTDFSVWWDAYNRLKHSWSSSTIDQANMDNVLNALAGAFLLNVVHLPSLRSLYDMGSVKDYIELGGGVFKKPADHIFRLQPDDFEEFFKEAERCALELKPVRFAWHYLIETPLFIFRHPRDTLVEKMTESRKTTATDQDRKEKKEASER